VRFSWAGDTDTGQVAAPGNYHLAGQYLGAGQTVNAETLVDSIVDSVSLRPSGLGIQLRGLGEYSFSSIEEIG
jgi:flagellar hook assembly protein FlgD